MALPAVDAFETGALFVTGFEGIDGWELAMRGPILSSSITCIANDWVTDRVSPGRSLSKSTA